MQRDKDAREGTARKPVPIKHGDLYKNVSVKASIWKKLREVRYQLERSAEYNPMAQQLGLGDTIKFLMEHWESRQEPKRADDASA